MTQPLKQSPRHPEVSRQLWQPPSHSPHAVGCTACDVQPGFRVRGPARYRTSACHVITVFWLLHLH